MNGRDTKVACFTVEVIEKYIEKKKNRVREGEKVEKEKRKVN